MKKLLILGINLLALSFILCLVSCEQAQNTAASIKTIVVHDTIDNTLTAQEYAAVMDIRNGKTAKKRNCANKQTFEGARGGIFHYDTSKTGNVYKHYVKQ